MSLRRFLRRMYRGLPIIQELRETNASLAALNDTLQRCATVAWPIMMAHDPRWADPKRLLRFAAQSFSQNGEDGMIAEIFRRIGITDHTFVEIGTGNGLENNTTLLLAQGWKGWWIDGDEPAMNRIERAFAQPLAEGRLRARCARVTAENIAGLCAELGLPNEFDLLSLDIDRNTYHLWAALSGYRPRVAVIEYNSNYPPEVDWQAAYRPDLVWKFTSYFGASLKAFERLGRERGYALVGCDFTGVNAFFVREDLVGERFAQPFTAENHYEPPRLGVTTRIGARAAFDDTPRRERKPKA